MFSFIGGAMFGAVIGMIIVSCFRSTESEDAFLYGILMERAERGLDVEIAGVMYKPYNEE